MEPKKLTKSEKELVDFVGLRSYEFDRKIYHGRQYLHVIDHAGNLAIIDVETRELVKKVNREEL
jgi:hypothetical protein